MGFNRLLSIYIFFFIFFFLSRFQICASTLRINEVYPSPETGNPEWLEIYNFGESDVDLTDWKIFETSSYYDYLPSQVLAPSEYIVLEDDEGNGLLNRVTLNNSGDDIYLLDSSDTEIHKIEYSSIDSSQSWAYQDGVFVKTDNITKGVENFPEEESEEFHATLRINELSPNPDSGSEWIEIYNYGDSGIFLGDWYIQDESSSPKRLLEIEVQPNDFIVLEDNDLDITLNNSGDIVSLLDPDENVVDSVEYDSIDKGVCLIFCENQFIVNSNCTKEGSNNCTGLEPQEIYKTLRINEVFPNPSEDNEWVEIYNYGSYDISLSGWKIKDESSSYKTITSDTIASKDYFIIENDDLRVSLNNGGDVLFLYSPEEDLVDKFEYDETDKDLSWIFYDNSIKLSSEVTKEKENIYEVLKNDNDFTTSGNSDDDNNDISIKTIAEARNSSLDNDVRVEGWLTVDLDVFGSNVFYLQDDSAGIRVKVKSGIDLTNFEQNDGVEIIGELRKSSEELYIYVSSSEDLVQSSKHIPELSISDLDIGKPEEFEGSIVQYKTVVDSISGKNIYLQDWEDLKVYIYEETKIDLEDLGIGKGSEIEVIGVLSQYKTSSTKNEGYRILPRNVNDIQLVKISQTENEDINQDFDNKSDNNSEDDSNKNISEDNLVSTIKDVDDKFKLVNNEVNQDDKVQYYEENIATTYNKEFGIVQDKFSKYSYLFLMSSIGLWETPFGRGMVGWLLDMISKFI